MDLKSSLCPAFCEKRWLLEVATKSVQLFCGFCLLMWVEIGSSLAVEGEEKW